MEHTTLRRTMALAGSGLLATTMVGTVGVPVMAQGSGAAGCESLNLLYATVEADVEAIKVGIPLNEQATGTTINPNPIHRPAVPK